MPQEAAKLDAARGRISHYASVVVLIFYWQLELINSGPSFEREIDALYETFSQLYGYAVEIFAIPSSQALNSVMRKMMDWADQHGSSDSNLLIVYYIGHGGHSGSGDKTLVLSEDEG